MTILAVLPKGRIISQVLLTQTPVAASTAVGFSATVTELKKVEAIIGVNISATGNTNVTAISTYIAPFGSNTVGLTAYNSSVAGTTAGGTVTVVGF